MKKGSTSEKGTKGKKKTGGKITIKEGILRQDVK